MKKLNRILFCLALCMCLVGFVPTAKAITLSCSLTQNGMSWGLTNLPSTITVDSTVQPGQAFATYNFSGTSTTTACVNGGVNLTNYQVMANLLATSGTPVPQYANMVYVDGGTNVGVRFLVNGTQAPLINGPTNGILTQTIASPGTYTFPPSATYSLQFYKLSNGPVSGTASNGTYGYVALNPNPYGVGNGAGAMNFRLGGAITFVTPKPTCTVSAPPAINLGDFNASQFTGQGTLIGSGSTSVSLTCTNSPTVTMALKATAASGYANVLALNSGAGVAQGVGVQLLYNGNALTVNGAAQSLSVLNGSLNFPILARYYQTTNNVSPGAANATGTLNFTYQ